MQFSEVWLERSKRYYSHLLATGRQPGLATLVALEWRLRLLADIEVFPETLEKLSAIGEALRETIKTRSVVDIRRHRPFQPLANR